MQFKKNRLFYSSAQGNKEKCQASCQILFSELRMMCPLPALTHAGMSYKATKDFPPPNSYIVEHYMVLPQDS